MDLGERGSRSFRVELTRLPKILGRMDELGDWRDKKEWKEF